MLNFNAVTICHGNRSKRRGATGEQANALNPRNRARQRQSRIGAELRDAQRVPQGAAVNGPPCRRAAWRKRKRTSQQLPLRRATIESSSRGTANASTCSHLICTTAYKVFGISDVVNRFQRAERVVPESRLIVRQLNPAPTDRSHVHCGDWNSLCCSRHAWASGFP